MKIEKSMGNLSAEVICVGTELLYNRVNTDVNIISTLLLERGLTIRRCTIVGDDEADIRDAVKEALSRSRVIFVTGGLGPTSDDITKEAIAALLGRELVFTAGIWEAITNRFKGRGIAIPEINKKQAYVIDGAAVISNGVGTAPGQIVKSGSCTIVILPGPPIELRPMAKEFISSLERSDLKVYRFGFAGLPESVAEEKIQKIFPAIGMGYTILAHPMLIEILAAAKPMLPEQLSKLESSLKEEFGPAYLGLEPPSLPELMCRLLKRMCMKLALAESCTGGLAGKIITDIPGSSEYFNGSFVAYSNTFKKKVLKVPKTTLKKYGAASSETAIAMALGAKKQGKADAAISYTGVAGPGGGSDKKPVGTVYIGLVLPKKRPMAYKFFFPGNRQLIRERSVYQGFELMRRALEEKETE